RVEGDGLVGGDLVDEFLREPGAEGGGQTAGGLDLLEESPGLAGEVVGEFFHIPRAAGGVGGLGEAELLGEQRVDVARDAAGDVVGDAGDLVEGRDVQAVHAAEHGGERLGGHAQHV